MFKFVHAADIHLDSPLLGLDQYEGAPVEAIRGATRRAFSNLVRLAISEQVNFVLLAGDIFDGDWKDYNTGLFFVKEIRELEKAGIPVVLISGNHDAMSQITKKLTYPKTVKVLSTDRPETIRFEKIAVAVHGQGYASQAENSNLALKYGPPAKGYFNIAMLHTSLDGRDGHHPYAPCTRDQLLALGFDYWALGHVHQRESVNGDRHPRVEFPGNIQGRHVRECGAKGCLLVTVDANGRANPEFRPLDVFRWKAFAVDGSGVRSMSEALDAVIEAFADEHGAGQPRAARVDLSCGEAVYREIAEHMVQFRYDLAGQAGSEIWVEKIKLSRASEKKPAEAKLGGDAASELRAALARLREDVDDSRAVFASDDCGKLQNTLPPELRGVFGENRDDIFDLAETLLAGDGQTEENP